MEDEPACDIPSDFDSTQVLIIFQLMQSMFLERQVCKSSYNDRRTNASS